MAATMATAMASLDTGRSAALEVTVGTFQAADGSRYYGTLRNGVPDGLGTCVWPDGSQYDGEWRAGQMSGFGTYVWKGGQRYDGEFKDGQRAGIGVKTYEDGSMYDGFWRNGKKHGLGVYRPCSEDARKHWHVLHQQQAGTSHSIVDSKRVADGVEAQQQGDEAAPHLVQLQLPPHLHHLQQPVATDVKASSLPVAAAGGTMQSALRDSHADLKLAELKQLNTGGVLPSPSVSGQQMGQHQGPLQLLIREYDEGRLLREYALSAEEIKTIFGFLWGKGRRRIRRGVRRVLMRREPRFQKKLGEVVYKGHYSYQLMLELQLGIRYCVGRTLRPRGSGDRGSGGGHTLVGRFLSGVPLHHSHPSSGGAVSSSGPQLASPSAPPAVALTAAASAALPPLVPADFAEKIRVSFPSAGSSTTPAHPSSDFKWKDYCPRVFRHLRSTFHIDDADYMLSLAGSQALRQLNSPGKSGSVFFLSEDERFLVKTMRKSEMDVLLEMLPRYVEHVTAHPNTLITRFFGLHRVTPAGGRTVRFVLMANIFVTEVQIHRRFDIKGSTEGRTAGVDRCDADPNVIFKDLDVDFKLALDTKEHDVLMKQLKADAELLQSCGVMDYSLLLGIHYPTRAAYKMSLDNAPSATLENLTPGGTDYRITSDSEGERDEAGTATATASGRATASSGGAPPVSSGDGSHLPGGLVSERSGSFNAPNAHVRLYGGGERMTSDEVGGDRARNFDLHSNAAELDVRLAKIQKRMEKLGFPEQRKKDILELARLKILGGKLKKSAARKEPPSAVLAAMQQQRQDGPAIAGIEGGALGPGPLGPLGIPMPARHPGLSHLSSMKGAFAGLGVQEEEEEEEALLGGTASVEYPRPQQLYQLGINTPALCIPADPSEKAEEVVVCFGIIDILQDYSLRKVMERRVKSLSHDSGSISVAPPKKYAQRFLDFLTANIFMGSNPSSKAHTSPPAPTAAPAPAAAANPAPAVAALPTVVESPPAAAAVADAAANGDAAKPTGFDKPVSVFALPTVQLAADWQLQQQHQQGQQAELKTKANIGDGAASPNAQHMIPAAPALVQ